MLQAEKNLLRLDVVAEESDQKREVAHVPLNPKAKAIVEDVRKTTGVPKTEALTRILEWYASLDPKLQLAILNRDQATIQELARLVVLKMAGWSLKAAVPFGEDIPEPSIEAMMEMGSILNRIPPEAGPGSNPKTSGTAGEKEGPRSGRLGQPPK